MRVYITSYQCDFCGVRVQDMVKSRWFRVTYDEFGYDACQKCGHAIMAILPALGLSYSKRCTQYEDSPEDTGYILISDDNRELKYIADTMKEIINKFDLKWEP